MPMDLPAFEDWSSTMADMVLFHQEQGLPWLWLPTPSLWIESLAADENQEQARLRAALVQPTTPQPSGLSWYAWDTRKADWVHNRTMLGQWYDHWYRAQVEAKRS